MPDYSGMTHYPYQGENYAGMLGDVMRMLREQARGTLANPVQMVSDPAMTMMTPQARAQLQGTAADMAPVIGGIRGAKAEWEAGNPWWAGLNAGSAALDAASLAAPIVAGPAWAARQMLKTAPRAAQGASEWGRMNTAGQQAADVMRAVPDLDPETMGFLSNLANQPGAQVPVTVAPEKFARAQKLSRDYAQARRGKERDLVEEKINEEFGGIGSLATIISGERGLLGNMFSRQRGAIGSRYKYGIPREQITVMDPKRAAYPGVYGDPREIAARAAQNVAPENPALQGLFGVTRDDLYQMHKGAVGNEPANVPGMAAKPKGSAVAKQVTNPKNTQRIVDVLSEAEKYPELVKGMDAWYEMRPLFQQMAQVSDNPVEDFKRFQAMTGMASPNADVMNELNRGTGALYLANQGRFKDFLDYGGLKASEKLRIAPSDMYGIAGHTTHSTAQALPMSKYLEAGELAMKSPKVPLYIQSAGVPETGFQTQWPVGDAHWSRGVGLADVRPMKMVKGQQAVPGQSISTPELATLGPWWESKVAGPLGINSVDAQARAWGTFAPATGVETAVGAPKLELIAQKIMDAAKAYNISPEHARDLLLQGKIYAPNLGLLGNVTLPLN